MDEGGLGRCLTDEMQRRFGLGGFFVRQIGLACRSFVPCHFLFLRHFFAMGTRCTSTDGKH